MLARKPLPLITLLAFAGCSQLPSPSPPVPSPFTEAELQMRFRLNAQLTPEPLDVENQPIEKVLRDLAEHNNINMIVDWTALNEVGVEKTTPVTLHLRHGTIDDAISAILSSVNDTSPLDYRIIGSLLCVSSKLNLVAFIPANYVGLQYDARDLITGPSITGTTNPNRRMAYLIDMITNQISPNTWQIINYPDAVPAPQPQRPPRNDINQQSTDRYPPFEPPGITNDAATGEGIISAFNTSLIITQTPEIQEEVGELLKQLRGQ